MQNFQSLWFFPKIMKLWEVEFRPTHHIATRANMIELVAQVANSCGPFMSDWTNGLNTITYAPMYVCSRPFAHHAAFHYSKMYKAIEGFFSICSWSSSIWTFSQKLYLFQDWGCLFFPLSMYSMRVPNTNTLIDGFQSFREKIRFHKFCFQIF